VVERRGIGGRPATVGQAQSTRTRGAAPLSAWRSCGLGLHGRCFRIGGAWGPAASGPNTCDELLGHGRVESRQDSDGVRGVELGEELLQIIERRARQFFIDL